MNKKKIIHITNQTPYRENRRGTSGHPYHLLIERPEEIEVEIYSFDYNHLTTKEIEETERELDVKIHIIPKPLWFEWIFRFHLLFLRIFFKYPIDSYLKIPKDLVKEIKSKNPNGIWIYGAELFRVAEQFLDVKKIHTLPDSIALYYYRMLSRRFVLQNSIKFIKCLAGYRKFIKLERRYSGGTSILYHMVGQEDAHFLENTNKNLLVQFIRHPHYEISFDNDKRNFTRPKTKLLIAGQYNHYMKQDADELVDLLCNQKLLEQTHLTDTFQLSFLGHGWESHANALKHAGWTVCHIPFAENYIEEIRKHDIQITPISIGTGTKGKVLDAFANGLLVIGSWYALENIAVKNGESCLMYHTVKDIPEMLEDIAVHKEKYEQMAQAGRESILKFHSRRRVSEELFGFFK